MWVRCNPNPKRKHVPDCVIRALAMDGQIIPLTIASATPAAVEQFWHVSGVKTIRVNFGCCPTVSVVNASVSATPATVPAPPVLIRNLNVTVNRVA